MGHIFCLDIGGTSIKYSAAHDADGKICFADCRETPTDAKVLRGPGLERRVLELVSALKDEYGTPAGVAISTAGMVDPKTGAILYANENIPEYTGRNLKRAVEERFDLACAVENDVNCAALGEFAYGAGAGERSLLCLTVGTGIGGAVILDGALWHGAANSAGEVGYLPMEGGSFQELASTSALVARVQGAIGETLTGREIFRRAIGGDTVCAREIERMCQVLARGIANCLCVLDPGAVLLGGGIMAQKDYLRPILSVYLKEYANPYILSHTKLAFASLGNHAGMAGAYYLLSKQGSK